MKSLLLLALCPLLATAGVIDDDKIVGGTFARKGEFPWIINMAMPGLFGMTQHICGGSLINESWVLTAAHCCKPFLDKPETITLIAGDYNRYLIESTEQKRTATKMINNEDYFSYGDDICLIKVNSPFELNEDVALAKLPPKKQDEAKDTKCVVAGWGTKIQGGQFQSVKLRKVQLPVITDDECRSVYGQSRILESDICAGYLKGGKDSCQGDSGGPFMCNGELTGVVSWGKGCAQPNYPGVYTQVSYYRDWIKKNIEKYSD